MLLGHSGEQRSRRRRRERDRSEERRALGNFAIKVGAQAYIFPQISLPCPSSSFPFIFENVRVFMQKSGFVCLGVFA